MILRPYQQEVVKAVVDSIVGNKGLCFSVEISRQGGKQSALSPSRSLINDVVHS